MLNRNLLALDQDSVVFAIRTHFFNSDNKILKRKRTEDHDSQKLFLLSKICIKDFFENMPKTFTITTKSSILYFNLEMLKATSPTITKFLQDNPDERNYNINITDSENTLTKFAKLYQGKNVIFKEEELPLLQQFTQILQIKNCPNYLKPRNLATNQIDSECNEIFTSIYQVQSKFLPVGAELCQKYFISFINKDDYKAFKIKTNQKEYICSIFGVYTSNVIRQNLEKDSTIDQFQYNFEDSENEFQLICDFFNGKKVEITNMNMDSLKSIAEDLQINCILQSVDNYINNYEKFSQKLDEQEKNVDSIDQLFDLLYNINQHGIDKVKNTILQSKWSQNDKYVEELAAFILQIVKPSFSLQKEMAELLIQLNKEANKDNKLNILIPFIVEKLMILYWPQIYQEIDQDKDKFISNTQEEINLTNKCVYSFIRILYKYGIIPKEEIKQRLKDYDLSNNVLNSFFLPEIIQINPKNIDSIDSLSRQKTSLFNHDPNLIYMHTRSFLNSDTIRSQLSKSQGGINYFWTKVAIKYLPDKIDLYEKMLDNMEPDDELTKSLRHDDVDKLQLIINNDGIDINKGKVPYNIFDDFEIDQSLINYSALYGSVKCFKYLMLNGGEIDDTTFYFAIYGGNNEIIKIVDQQCPKEENVNSSNQDRNIVYLNIDNNRTYVSFWFEFYNLNPQIYTDPPFSRNNNFSLYDKYNDHNIQYETRTLKGDAICFLNCSNINNIIAPTIANHKNDLFDWIFDNNFVNKGKNGNDLKYIADLSALCGNIHSLIAINDNGFFVTRKLISFAAKNGFLTLTRLLLDIYDKKVTDDSNSIDSDDSFDYNSIVHFGNLSIFKLFIKYMNKSNLEQSILHAIEVNSTIIITYIFDNLYKFDFSINDETFIKSALKLSLKIKSIALFSYLINEFKKLNPDTFKLDLFSNLLNQACLDSNLEATKTITELIDKENPKYDFTEAFFNACSSKSNDICRYFIDKKVAIDFANNSRISELGIVDIDIFEKIVNNADPKLKFLFYECINKSISNKNIQVIEFILQNNPPCKSELILAVESDDLEVVELILKYNSSASFINRKTINGTALCIAIQNKNIDIVKRLLSIHEINPNLTDVNNQNALLLAAQNHDIDIIDAILNFYGDDIQYQQSQIYSTMTLMIAKIVSEVREVSQEEWNIFKRFLQIKSIKPSFIPDNRFFSLSIQLLYIACFENKIDIVEFFLSLENVDTNVYDSYTYNTPLMLCLEKKHINLAKLLINHPKTNINLRNCENETALVISVKNEQKEIIEILTKDERFDPNESLLNYAFIYSNNEVSKQLYELSSLDVNESFYVSAQKEEINALYHATEINDIDKIDMIINHPSFNIYKSKINKCIFKAAKNNNVEVFEKLISLIDNNINIVNENRESLLTYACMNLSGNIIDLILNNGHFDPKNEQIIYAFVQSYSNSTQENNQDNQPPAGPAGHFPLRNRYNRVDVQRLYETNNLVLNEELIPAKSSIIEIMEMILNYDKEHEQLIKFGELLPNGKSFFTSISSNYSDINEVIEFLHSQGVDVNQADKEGIYPLEHAIKMNSIDMVRFLVNTESIDYSQLNNGFTYLHLAAEIKESTILSFLLQLNKIDINSVNVLGETPFMLACRKLNVDNINILFNKKDIDYLHCNKSGKDALDIFVSLSQDEKQSIKQNKDQFYNKLISIINEMLDPNK